MQAQLKINSSPENDDIIGDYDHIPDFYSIYTKNERDIIVLLPPSYKSCMKPYPVLYIHDGQNVFNPKTSFTGFDWKVDETFRRLIVSNLIREVIVVAIYNTRNRIDEYNLDTSKGKSYSHFLIYELKNYIDEQYRTLTGSYDTATMGSSMGGLFSFQLFINYPSVFGKAACMSSSFWVDDRKIFTKITDHKPREKSRLYIDCGLHEKELLTDTKQMCRIIKNIGYDKKNFKCYFDENGKHNESSWAKRVHIPLSFLFSINDE
ncbi:MAG: alpha/beta hydrolase [Melioribacteraceae bacterium]|nr:alpha/beta hydrolase [Melioribacteraceae bacterium]